MIPSHRTSKRARGFTLIEVVIAIFILSAILTVGYTALRNIMRSKVSLDAKREGQSEADAIMARFTREFQLAYANGNALLPPRNNLQQPYSIRINLVGEPGANSESDTITFLALEGGQYLPDGGGHSGLVQLQYRVVDTPKEDAEVPRGRSLVREETPYLRPPERAYKKSMVYPLSHRVKELRLRYYDKDRNQWVTQWGDAEHEGLPSVIWVSLTLLSDTEKESTFATLIPLTPQ